MLKKPNSIPSESGIYLFKDARGKILYVGKAANIKKRLASYFLKNIPDRIQRLREDARHLSFETTTNEFDALVREAECIKKYRPPYNIVMRDDKNYLYVIFIKEKFSRIYITHQPHSGRERTLGPFTEGRPLYAILKLLRKVFPYCTCKHLHKRRCVNSEIGRCPGYCCTLPITASYLERSQYKKNVDAIKNVLSGKSQKLLKNIWQDMTVASKKKEFEKAAELRDMYFDLQSIMAHRAIIEDKNPFLLKNAASSSRLQDIVGSKKPVIRIEGYDISNISGAHATASLVVFENGRPRKDEYKRFKIRFRGISDFDMLKEALMRRMDHPEWPYPDMLLIDGGKPQLQAVASVLKQKFGTRFPFVLAGLAKAKNEYGKTLRKASAREVFHIYGGKKIPTGALPEALAHLLQAVRDEAHRFAKKYHILLRVRSFTHTE